MPKLEELPLKKDFLPRNYSFEKITDKDNRELGLKFIQRWFAPELIPLFEASGNVFVEVGIELKNIAKNFPTQYSCQKVKSCLNLGDLKMPQLGENNRYRGDRLMETLLTKISLADLYPKVGSKVKLREIDFLVTTPLQQHQAHAEEAAERLQEFQEQGTVGFYYRSFNPWTAPQQLKIGSRFFYVDNRAIRGFAVITGLKVDDMDNSLYALMQADSWYWIKAIPCDYDQIKPPQRYAYINDHQYTKEISTVQVVGNWLSLMPS